MSSERRLDDAALQEWSRKVVAAGQRAGRPSTIRLIEARLRSARTFYLRTARTEGHVRAVRRLAGEGGRRVRSAVGRRGARWPGRRARPRRTRLVIDATPLGTPRMSGVGATLVGMLEVLSRDPRVISEYDIVLVTTGPGKPFVEAHGWPNVRYRKLPGPKRGFWALQRWRLLPPMDLWFGRGVYVFGNYRMWPVSLSKSVVFVHDLAYLFHPEVVEPALRARLTTWVPRWVRQATVVATTSATTAADVRRELRVSAARTLVVRCGVDLSQFRPRSPAETAKVRDRFGLPEQYLLYLGNIEPRKNLIRLIQAYAAIPEHIRDDVPLVLVGGGGWLNDEVFAAVDAAQTAGVQIVRPSNYVPDADLPALISGATALVNVAIWEGFGMTPLQAMACGVPVVAADNSAVPEVVGDAAVLVDALQVPDIAAGLDRVLTDPVLRRRLSRAGLERAQGFTWERGVQPLIDWLSDTR